VRRFKSTQITTWRVRASLILIGFLVGGGMVMGIYGYVYGAPLGGDALAPQASVLSLGTPSAGPAPKVIRVAEDPIVVAKQLKPLADIQRDDRVIYQGRTCSWLQWSGNINTSLIKCANRPPQQTDTVQLTPVENRGAP
jgi:hypothetical protein